MAKTSVSRAKSAKAMKVPRRKKERKPAEARTMEKRWTPALVKDGWTGISNSFLKNYSQLHPAITTSEAMLIIQLMVYKWDDEAPYPGFKTLAKRMGISTTAARGHARRLERKNYLLRKMRVGQTNEFYLDQLFAALEKHMEEKQKKAKKEEAAAKAKSRYREADAD